jgi:hypothetical protein
MTKLAFPKKAGGGKEQAEGLFAFVTFVRLSGVEQLSHSQAR